jgi:hypothetical protein
MSESGPTKVASSVVDALRQQPLVLGLIVITAVFMYFVYSGVTANRNQINELFKIMIERCK